MDRALKVFTPAVVLLLLGAAVSLYAGLQIGGAADPRTVADPGAIVRYLLPASRTAVNLSLSVMLGALLIAVWALATDKNEYGRVMDLAAGAAAVLTVSSGTALIATYLDVSLQPFSASQAFGAGLGQFVSELELGRLWIELVALAAVTTVLCFAVRSRRLTLLPLVTAVLCLLPLAAQGHAAGASGHSLAVNAMFLHIGGAAVWIGGLVTIVYLALFSTPERFAVLVRRYSFLALLASIAVFCSGVLSGMLRLGDLSNLFTTGYGQLLVLKTAAMIVLLGFGAWHRIRLIPRLAAAKPRGAAAKHPGAAKQLAAAKQPREAKIPAGEAKQTAIYRTRLFLWFVVSEIAIMGIASGLAGALGRTETPVTIQPARELGTTITPAEWLTGDPLPPELTPDRIFTQWKFDLLWILIAVFGIAIYYYGVIKLRRRGDKWGIGRTISWTAGMLVLFWVTNGYLNAYEAYLFSSHMLGHMFLTMLIPMLLVLGAPVTLLLRAAEKRRDGSWGPREWVVWALDTPWAKLVSNPIFAAIMFSGSLWIFYFTPILRWAMEEHIGHQWMIVHFLLSGYLFALTLIGIDPVPNRFSYPLRLVLLLATMAAHAFFGVTIMSGEGLLAADWFGAMGREWGDPPLQDQQNGGGIAWGIGEIPTLLLTLIVSVQWARADDKEQRRRDRAADRTGDAELRAYNEMLQQRAERQQTRR